MINWNISKDENPKRRMCFVAGNRDEYLFTSLAIFEDGIFLDISGNPLNFDVTHWVYAYHPDAL